MKNSQEEVLSIKIMGTDDKKNVNVTPDYVTHSELEDELDNYQPKGDYATQNDIEGLHEEIIAMGGVKFVEEREEEG